MAETFLDLPTPEDQRISRLYCWVTIHEDGSEGIPAHSMPDGSMMPLITSKRRVAETALRRFAETVSAASARAGKPVRLELRIFDAASG